MLEKNLKKYYKEDGTPKEFRIQSIMQKDNFDNFPEDKIIVLSVPEYESLKNIEKEQSLKHQEEIETLQKTINELKQQIDSESEKESEDIQNKIAIIEDKHNKSLAEKDATINSLSEKIHDLDKEKSNEISDLKIDHAKEIGSLETNHAKEIGSIEKKHNEKIDKIKNSFLKEAIKRDTEITNLLDELQKLSFFDKTIFKKDKKIIKDYKTVKTVKLEDKSTNTYILNDKN